MTPILRVAFGASQSDRRNPGRGHNSGCGVFKQEGACVRLTNGMLGEASGVAIMSWMHSGMATLQYDKTCNLI